VEVEGETCGMEGTGEVARQLESLEAGEYSVL